LLRSITRFLAQMIETIVMKSNTNDKIKYMNEKLFSNK